LVDNSVTTSKIVDNSITTSKLVDQSVATNKITDGAVTSIKLDPVLLATINNKKSTADSRGTAGAGKVELIGADIDPITLGVKRLASGGTIVLTQDGDTVTIASPLSSGEANTASNIGTAGTGVFKQKTGINLELKKLNTASNKLSIVDDLVNNKIDFDVNQANLSLGSIGGAINLSTQTSGTLPGGSLPAHTHIAADVTNFTTAAQTAAVQNSLAASTVIAPSATSVNTALAGKQNLIVPANVTAGSTKVTLGGTPAGATLQSFSVDVNEANFAVPQANVIGLVASLAGKEPTITILPVTRGGTGVTTSTGSGSNVQSVGPTITSPTISGATITSSTVNGVTLNNGAGSGTFLNGAGAYTTPISTVPADYHTNLTAGDWRLASSSTATDYTTASLELQAANFASGLSATSPRLALHWNGVVASQIGIESSGRIAILDNPGTGYENFIARDITATGQVNLQSMLSANGNVGTSGQILTSQGTGASPIWTSQSLVKYINVGNNTVNNPNNYNGSTGGALSSGTITFTAEELLLGKGYHFKSLIDVATSSGATGAGGGTLTFQVRFGGTVLMSYTLDHQTSPFVGVGSTLSIELNCEITFYANNTFYAFGYIDSQLRGRSGYTQAGVNRSASGSIIRHVTGEPNNTSIVRDLQNGVGAFSITTGTSMFLNIINSASAALYEVNPFYTRIERLN
jgi:hypothetical protein